MTTENQEGTVAPALPTPAVVAPAPAPAPAPEVKPVDQPKPADAPVVPEAIVPVEYAPIEDDPGLTMALQFVGKLGIGPDSPEMQAALKGDFTFLKAKLASAGAAASGFEHYVAMAEKSWDNHVKVSSEQATKTAGLIHEAVGSEETWKEIQGWAAANAEPAEKETINAMLNAGGFQARAAAALLQQLYVKASGTVQTPAPAAAQVAANGASPVHAALSPEAYQKEVSALVSKLGPIGASKSPEWATLQQRRANYRG